MSTLAVVEEILRETSVPMSVREIVGMDGFEDLLWEDQKAVANMRENLIVMDSAANSSKSDWSWRSWPQKSRFYGEDAIARMTEREDTVRGLIQQEIDKRLAALRAGARK